MRRVAQQYLLCSPTLDSSSLTQIPSEEMISHKWDACLERMVINFGMGVLVGGLAAVVLTSKEKFRSAE